VDLTPARKEVRRPHFVRYMAFQRRAARHRRESLEEVQREYVLFCQAETLRLEAIRLEKQEADDRARHSDVAEARARRVLSIVLGRMRLWREEEVARRKREVPIARAYRSRPGKGQEISSKEAAKRERQRAAALATNEARAAKGLKPPGAQEVVMPKLSAVEQQAIARNVALMRQSTPRKVVPPTPRDQPSSQAPVSSGSGSGTMSMAELMAKFKGKGGK